MSVSNREDVLDVRDIIDEYEAEQSAALGALLRDISAHHESPGDFKWDRRYYPPRLIRDSHLADHLKREVEDDPRYGRLLKERIDWEDVLDHARRSEFTSVEYGGVTYWYA